jgi:hypothetical protein
MQRFHLPSEAFELLMFLDRFRIAVLPYADVLEVTAAECRVIANDYLRLQRVLSAIHSPNRGGASPIRRIVLPDVRSRVARLVARIESHPAYTAQIGVALGLVSEIDAHEFVFCAPQRTYQSDRAVLGAAVMASRN